MRDLLEIDCLEGVLQIYDRAVDAGMKLSNFLREERVHIMVFGIFRFKEKMNEEIKDIALNNLKRKYKEDFTVEEIQRHFLTGSYSVVFSPLSNQNMKCTLQIKGKTVVGDSYMNEVFSEKQDIFLEELLQPVFQNEIVVFSFLKPIIGSGWWPSDQFKDKNMSLDDFLDKNISYVENCIRIFVKSDFEIDIDREAEKINQVVDILLELGFKEQDIMIIYLESGTFEKMKNERIKKYDWESDEILEDFAIANSRDYAWIMVLDGEKVFENTDSDDFVEEIKCNFELNREFIFEYE